MDPKENGRITIANIDAEKLKSFGTKLKKFSKQPKVDSIFLIKRPKRRGRKILTSYSCYP